eukprot:TRINITY_DN4775_c0_g1_i2.p1 TRINITY_DN4775_c0_g1~~TRINITY_DN4775_c0_g1_i2.p1  ORF type:complete len:731 (+),score=198.84 TRINITY_DN4775_c0_g1_i2:37-2229(+)
MDRGEAKKLFQLSKERKRTKRVQPPKAGTKQHDNLQRILVEAGVTPSTLTTDNRVPRVVLEVLKEELDPEGTFLRTKFVRQQRRPTVVSVFPEEKPEEVQSKKDPGEKNEEELEENPEEVPRRTGIAYAMPWIEASTQIVEGMTDEQSQIITHRISKRLSKLHPANTDNDFEQSLYPLGEDANEGEIDIVQVLYDTWDSWDCKRDSDDEETDADCGEREKRESSPIRCDLGERKLEERKEETDSICPTSDLIPYQSRSHGESSETLALWSTWDTGRIDLNKLTNECKSTVAPKSIAATTKAQGPSSSGHQTKELERKRERELEGGKEIQESLAASPAPDTNDKGKKPNKTIVLKTKRMVAHEAFLQTGNKVTPPQSTGPQTPLKTATVWAMQKGNRTNEKPRGSLGGKREKQVEDPAKEVEEPQKQEPHIPVIKGRGSLGGKREKPIEEPLDEVEETPEPSESINTRHFMSGSGSGELYDRGEWADWNSVSDYMIEYYHLNILSKEIEATGDEDEQVHWNSTSTEKINSDTRRKIEEKKGDEEMEDWEGQGDWGDWDDVSVLMLEALDPITRGGTQEKTTQKNMKQTSPSKFLDDTLVACKPNLNDESSPELLSPSITSSSPRRDTEREHVLFEEEQLYLKSMLSPKQSGSFLDVCSEVHVDPSNAVDMVVLLKMIQQETEKLKEATESLAEERKISERQKQTWCSDMDTKIVDWGLLKRERDEFQEIRR